MIRPSVRVITLPPFFIKSTFAYKNSFLFQFELCTEWNSIWKNTSFWSKASLWPNQLWWSWLWCYIDCFSTSPVYPSELCKYSNLQANSLSMRTKYTCIRVAVHAWFNNISSFLCSQIQKNASSGFDLWLTEFGLKLILVEKKTVDLLFNDIDVNTVRVLFACLCS